MGCAPIAGGMGAAQGLVMRTPWLLALPLISTLAVGCEVGEPADLSDEELINSEFPEETVDGLSTQDYTGCRVTSPWLSFTRISEPVEHRPWGIRTEGVAATLEGSIADCYDYCNVVGAWVREVTGRDYRTTYGRVYDRDALGPEWDECRVYQSWRF